MTIELKVPEVGESITEVRIAQWLKHEGDIVEKDESVAELESDKATVELPAPAAGRLGKVLKGDGETAAVGEVIGQLEPGDGALPERDAAAEKSASAPTEKPPAAETPDQKLPPRNGGLPKVMPAAERELAVRGLSASDVRATGPGGRLLKEDVLRHDLAKTEPAEARAPAERAKPAVEPNREKPAARQPADSGGRQVEVVPLTPLRKRIAERLVQAQQSAALLTTFNEIDLGAVVAMRHEHRDAFQKKHGVKLGFTAFFVKATIEALKEYPQLNAELRESEIVFHNYFDIGIAVSTEKGLVVPVLRNAERMSFADIEKAVEDFGRRAKDNKIGLDELKGGTFTITNGGVFGSLLSTPIVNPPQSGILGLHAIQDRPVARDGQVVIRPMMYVALTYDHRIVDGREAVTFLRHIKGSIEQPARMLLEL